VAVLEPINPERVSTEKTPTARQVYALAHLALSALGYAWPESRRDASVVISALCLEAEQ
jgi:hypothetical protein